MRALREQAARLAQLQRLDPDLPDNKFAAQQRVEIDSRGDEVSPGVRSGKGEAGRRDKPGDLLLLDVAASYANYNSDLTRTLPVSGKFTRRQKQVYAAVLRVLRQSIQGLVAGRLLKDWQREAEQLIQVELLGLDLLTPRQIKAQDPGRPALKKYFMHGVGHPLGLDVHDVSPVAQPLQAGWVMTVEPAIYIPEEGLGIRLENDVLVTETGPVDLMAHIPIEIADIEKLMAGKKV